MYHAIVKYHLAKIDHENLTLKLEKWKLDLPNGKMVYRPYGYHLQGTVIIEYYITMSCLRNYISF